MPAPRALLTRAAGVAVGVSLMVTLLPSGPAAAAPPPAAGPTVRLVVRTDNRAAGVEVTAAAVRQGARPSGRVGRLRAVSLDVARSEVSRLTRTLLRRDDVRRVDQAARRWLTADPADPRYPEQRAYFDAVRAPQAWDRPARGGAEVRIAVIDSGADVSHPDLVGKVVGTYNPVSGGSDVRDLVGHGTGVASVAGAASNNGEGMTGAGYDSSLLVAKVADLTGRIFTDDLAKGIVWAVDSGADVINLSLGGPSSDRLERDAVAYAQRKGVLVVAAAGNEGSRDKQFPAALPDVLSVGATVVNGSSRASFSSYGSWVDVAAPGKDLLVARPGGGYERADGTSFAAPLVAGQVGLLAGLRPGRSAAELSQAVVDGANTARLGFARGLVDFAASLDLLAPGSAPVLATPAEGATVSGVTTVTATSGAPKVRLTLGDLSAVVATENGQASRSFETFGLRGPQAVTATDCSRIDQCSSATAATAVLVANTAPTLTAPAGGSDASADSVTAAAEAGGGSVGFLLDGRLVATDTAAPFTAALPTESLANGTHTVSAVPCRSDGTVCDTGTRSDAAVTVDRLHPRVVTASTRLLSPDGDGRKDVATLRYRLPDTQAVTFRVRDAAGRVLLSRREGRRTAGLHRLAWDGRGENGRRVANGPVTLEVSTRAGGRLGLATRPVTVDTRAPKVAKISSTEATVHPDRDGYLDATTLTGRLRESARWVRVEASSPGGRTVRFAKDRRVAAGPVSVDWDARSGRGPLPAGRYAVRLVAQDAAGNRTASAPVTVTVSRQRLVKRTGTVTVSARRSLDETFSDDCSLVFAHSEGRRTGWIGHYSSATCSSRDAYAVGDHEVRLPAAVRYGTVRVSAFGGRGDDRFRDSAKVVYYDRYENASSRSFRLGPATGTYTGPRVRAEKLLTGTRTLRWGTRTTGTGWYDVRDYTVRYTYFVLR